MVFVLEQVRELSYKTLISLLIYHIDAWCGLIIRGQSEFNKTPRGKSLLHFHLQLTVTLWDD